MRFMFDYGNNREKYNVIYSGGIIFLGSIIAYSPIFFVFAYINNNVKSIYFNFNDYLKDGKRGQTPSGTVYLYHCLSV